MNLAVHDSFSASPEAVAAIMFDPTREPSWIPAVKNVELIGDWSKWRVGLQVMRSGNVFGKTSWIAEVFAYDYPNRIVWRYGEGFRSGLETYEITPDGLGSRVSIHVQDDASREAIIWRWLQSTLFRAAYIKNLQRLKKMVENCQA